MEGCQLLTLLFVVVLAVTTVESCMVTYPWKPLTLEQTVSGADIVVFGQESEHVHSSKWSWGTDAVFHVYCVLKTDGGPPIPERVVVEAVRPIHSCMGTYTRLGEVMMLALRRTESGNFRWHELGIMQTAKFSPTQDNLQRALRVVGQEAVMTPEGRDPLTQPSCPLLPNNQTPKEHIVNTTKGSGGKLKKKLQKKWQKKQQAVETSDIWTFPENEVEDQGSGELHVYL